MTEPQRDGLIALLDLDGTLANYDDALERDLRSLLSPEEQDTWVRDESQEYVKRRIRLVRSQPGWWKRLAKLEDGFKLVDLLRSKGFSLNVLTKGPYNHPNSWSEKVEWCREHLPDASITITEDKSIVYGKVLADDWPPYVSSWLEFRPRGLVILPDRPWNQGFGDENPQIIRYRDNLDVINKALDKLIEQSLLKKNGELDG